MKSQQKSLLEVIGIILLFFTAASCQRIDLSKLDTQPYYHANYDGKDVVLRIDSVGAKSVFGRWYVTVDERVVKPQPFCATLKRGNEIDVQASAFLGGMTALVSLDFTSITVKFAKNGRSMRLRFEPIEVPEFNPCESEYLRPTYQVKPPIEDVVYGNASGYWSSYREIPGGQNDYVAIVKPKLSELIFEKDVELCMDIYQPECNDSIRRPLLMLIHGGAFFNGDKQSQAYQRWAEYFASLGYIVASINYRLGFGLGVRLGGGPTNEIGATKESVDRAGYKAVQDAHAAMRYLVHYADKYKIDTNFLFVGGSSAGGITALNLAFMRNWNRPETVINGRYRITGDSNLGFIDAVSPQYNENFTIKAVVNMWGAVHDTTMLRNSPQTAILSFHGDADRIVAYGHDYPFMDPPTPLRDVLALFGINLPPMKKINEKLFDPMYGSYCIHQQALALGMHSELHTYPNGPHSLHMNNDGTLSDYFHVIQDTTTVFLYRQLVPTQVELVELPDGPQWFGMTNSTALQSFSFKVEGGVLLQTDKDKMRAFFFADAPEHKILVSGTYLNGVGIYDTYYLINNKLIR